jgi:hypothetical protein
MMYIVYTINKAEIEMATSSTTTKAEAKLSSAQAKKKPASTKPKAPAVKASAGKAPQGNGATSGATSAMEKPRVESSAVPKEKNKKAKLVRDSFTMPETEYKALADVKRDCLKAGIEVKKSELLRVGVALVRQMELEKLKNVLSTLPPLKTGRPKKEK